MNTLIVTQTHSVTVAGLASKTLNAGERVAPSSPFYWSVLWSGYGTDSGSPDPTGDEEPFKPSMIIVGEEDPQLGPGGVWVQTFPNGDWTMWIEDGK